MQFSKYFNLNGYSQKDFEFIDIRVDWDNKLFIDPTRIEAENDSLAVECDQIILDFFNTILDLYCANKINEARGNLVYSGESNEIYLGYTEGFPQGTGNSEEELNEIFNNIHINELISKGLIGRIEDLHVFIDNFGCDKMSDLIASLIKKKLVEFTIQQCEIYNINRDFKLTKNFWNHVSNEWEEFTECVPSVKGPGNRDFPVVLVPKRFIVSDYLYDAEKYWEKIVSIRRQEHHKQERTQLYINKANNRGQLNKKEILDYESEGRSLKEYLIDYTENDLSAINSFRQGIKNTQRSNENNALSDEEIDKIVNESIDKLSVGKVV
ncbi:hypothetical protein [Lysinibacillus sp. fls2-241-R2A-57]|uniref:hypothetical protein n=1 Tax=Lysinibacillus sp. fls2-241-R2A-57 TaxID=3040292 RepID=UPI002552CF45|nr:hypothetical protein [Lysinibacillus sp. fls2-241-R2A-57]